MERWPRSANGLQRESVTPRGQRKAKHEDRPATAFTADANAAVVVFDDSLADGKPQAGAARLSISDKRLEEPRHHLRSDAVTRVLDFSDDLPVVLGEAQFDPTPAWHGVTRSIGQVVKHRGQPCRIEKEVDRRRRVRELDTHRPG